MLELCQRTSLCNEPGRIAGLRERMVAAMHVYHFVTAFPADTPFKAQAAKVHGLAYSLMCSRSLNMPVKYGRGSLDAASLT
jgi:hypothetical protein